MLSSVRNSKACDSNKSNAIVSLMESDLTPIEYACALVGGKARLSEILDVTPATVSQWVHRRRPVPSERCSQIEAATNGLVTCEQLRPDLAEHWRYLRGGIPVASARTPALKRHRYHPRGAEPSSADLFPALGDEAST